MLHSQCCEPFALADEYPVSCDHESARLQLGQSGKGSIEIVLAAGIEDVDLDSERAGCCLKISRLSFRVGIVRIDERANSCRPGHYVVQEFQSLWLQFNA